MKNLGKTQKAVLESLVRHGSWGPSAGWIWSNDSTTRRVLDSLVRAGMVRRVGSTYRPTETGLGEVPYVNIREDVR